MLKRLTMNDEHEDLVWHSCNTCWTPGFGVVAFRYLTSISVTPLVYSLNCITITLFVDSRPNPNLINILIISNNFHLLSYLISKVTSISLVKLTIMSMVSLESMVTSVATLISKVILCNSNVRCITSNSQLDCNPHS
jgi:hypothetical protein